MEVCGVCRWRPQIDSGALAKTIKTLQPENANARLRTSLASLAENAREREKRRMPTTDQRRTPPITALFQNHRSRHVPTELRDRNQNFHIFFKE